MERTWNESRLWLGLCVVSLAAYLLRSESLRAFGREVSRLFGKFCG